MQIPPFVSPSDDQDFMAQAMELAAQAAQIGEVPVCALETLQEIVDADVSLHMWFDRGLDFGHGSLVDASLGNLPRVVTSRSQDTQKLIVG